MPLMLRLVRFVVKFAVAFLVMTAICTVMWELVIHNALYDCTDPGFLDYLTPGDWVHAHDGLSVVSVSKVMHDHEMSDPDTIREGWGVGGLWCVWFSFVFASVVASVFVARKQWITNERI